MEEFKIRKDSFKEIRNEVLVKVIPILLVSGIGALVILYFNLSAQQIEVNALPIAAPIVLASMAFGVYRMINMQKDIFESYRLTLDENSITREQYNAPKITILKKDVSEILKNTNGSFVIKGSSALNVIGIPAQIEQYQKIEESLSQMRSITVISKEPLLQKIRIPLTIFSIGLMAAVYISTNKTIVAICGTVLLMLLGYSFYEIQSNQSIDKKTKNGTLGVLIGIASIIGIMYYKLTS